MEPTDTPQKYGATEDDELSCFLSVEDKKEIRKAFSQVKNSFTNRMPLASMNDNLGKVHRPSAPINVPKPITDDDYCEQQMNSGRYYGPMMEVVAHPPLESMLLDKLKIVDRRLYDVRCSKGA